VQIFIHNKNTNNNNNNNDNINLPDDLNNNCNNCIHIIPTVHTWRSTVSLVRATIQLLKYATNYYENENENENENGDVVYDENGKPVQFDQYVLVSGDTVPLLNAASVMKELSKESSNGSSSNSYSRFEQHIQNQYPNPYIFRYGINVDQPNMGYGGIGNNVNRSPPSNYGYKKMIKSKQWFTMTHNDALFFASNTNTNTNTNSNKNGNGNGNGNDETFNFELMSTSDEYYFATLSNEYQSQNDDEAAAATATATLGRRPGLFVRNEPFMYDVWPTNKQAKSPSNIDIIDDTIYKNSGHLFARKITKQTNISLAWLEPFELNSNKLKSSFLSDNNVVDFDVVVELNLIPGQVMPLTPNFYKQLSLKSQQQQQQQQQQASNTDQYFVQVNSKICGIQRRQQQQQQQQQVQKNNNNNNNNICDQIYNNLWKLIAKQYPNQLFVLLDCDDIDNNDSEQLCKTIYKTAPIPTSIEYNDRQTMLEQKLYVDFLTISSHHDTQHQNIDGKSDNDGRWIEFYNDKLDAQSLVNYFQNKIIINDSDNGNDNGSGNTNNNDNNRRNNQEL
jgi:hypothetical protein